MSVKIRLQRRGRRKQPFYHIVVADARAPRDGRFIEKIGTYNPMTKPATIDLDRDRAYDWLMKGAQPTDTARAILRFKGVMYRKHLMRGVKKGALTQDQADEMYNKWIEAKEAKIAARFEVSKAEKDAWNKALSGKAKAAPAPAASAASKDSAPAPQEQKSFADSVEQTTVESFSNDAPAVKTPAVEATPAPEPAAEKVEVPAPAVEEAPAPVAEETPAPVVEKAAPEAKATTPADDLKMIEGIGPKIAQVLGEGGITTFAKLAEATPESIKEILNNAEGNFKAHDPGTWPAQGKMAAAGNWDELKKWQDELDGGKVAAKSEEE